MANRVGEWITSGRSYVKGYELVFNHASTRWGGHTANLRKTGVATDIVYGAVYKLNKTKLDVLSEYEGKSPTPIDVVMEDGWTERNVLCYLWAIDEISQKPSTAYANTILEGLRHHGYDELVVKEVESHFQ